MIEKDTSFKWKWADTEYRKKEYVRCHSVITGYWKSPAEMTDPLHFNKFPVNKIS